MVVVDREGGHSVHWVDGWGGTLWGQAASAVTHLCALGCVGGLGNIGLAPGHLAYLARAALSPGAQVQ